jgi:hypothetical protein
MLKGASFIAGSSASFVEGPMRRTGDGVWYTLPIGKGSIYAPMGYYNTNGYALTDTFTAEYFRSNPQSIYGNNYDPVGNPEIINHISYAEYWSLEKNAGAIPGTVVSLFVNDYSFCTNLNTTFIARHNAADNQWKNCFTTYRDLVTPGPPFVTGTIEGVAGTVLGIFTLATSDNNATNPLPINLLSFDATKLTRTEASVNWELAVCCSSAVKFEVQRAGADKRFATIGTVAGSETNKLYNYIDNGLKNGINYYRLKMIDADGKITYSRTVAIINEVNGVLLVSLIPTVITNTAALTITSSKEQKLDIVIADIQGRVMQKQNYTIAAGNTSIQLSAEHLAAGVYQLIGITSEGKTNLIRFIRQ